MFELVSFIRWMLQLYMWIVVGRALISWVNPDPRNPIVRFLRQVTEPALAPIRQFLPPWKTAGIDFSPLILILAIQFVDWVILPVLARSLY